MKLWKQEQTTMNDTTCTHGHLTDQNTSQLHAAQGHTCCFLSQSILLIVVQPSCLAPNHYLLLCDKDSVTVQLLTPCNTLQSLATYITDKCQQVFFVIQLCNTRTTAIFQTHTQCNRFNNQLNACEETFRHHWSASSYRKDAIPVTQSKQ